MPFERIFRRQTQKEIPAGLSTEAGSIYLKASEWVSKNLVDTNLAKQPFALSEPEIEIIKTSLEEKKVAELLSRRKFKNTADRFEIEFGRFFKMFYDNMSDRLIAKYSLPRTAEIVAAFNTYIFNAQGFAAVFVKGRNSIDEQRKAANKIRAKNPIAMLMHTKSARLF